jgi:flagella basal body P-ring formation protein FlgA
MGRASSMAFVMKLPLWCTARVAWALGTVISVAHASTPAAADGTSAVDGLLADRVQQLAREAVRRTEADMRLQIEVGHLDPRLKLAPCTRITPFVPAGARLWGATRVGLRCDEGARWSVYLPVRVKVFAQALVLAQALPAGTVISEAHLTRAEIDIAGAPGAALQRESQALGHALNRALAAGTALRQSDLRPRQWFAAGDTVRIVARGRGYLAVSEGQALGPGVEGQSARARTETGRIVTGRASGPRQMDLAL